MNDREADDAGHSVKLCPLCGARITYTGYSLIRSAMLDKPDVETRASAYRCAGRYHGTAPRETHLIFVTDEGGF